MMLNQIPDWWSLFKARYYKDNTYLTPSPLTDTALAPYLLSAIDSELATKVQKLISKPGLAEILSEPSSSEVEEIRANNAILESHGFTVIGRVPFCSPKDGVRWHSAIEHPELPGWIIKCGSTRVLSNEFRVGGKSSLNEYPLFHPEDHISRVLMAAHISRVAIKEGIALRVPRQYLIPYPHPITYPNQDERNHSIVRKYFVICEKLEVFTEQDTLNAIGEKPPEVQRELARKISTIVTKVGLAGASFKTIRLTEEGHLAVLNTKPRGLGVAEKPRIEEGPRGWNLDAFLFGGRTSIEKCGRIGLYSLNEQLCHYKIAMEYKGEWRLGPFYAQLIEDEKKISPPKFSKWKIALSGVIFLIPLWNAIMAYIKLRRMKQVAKKLIALESQRDCLLQQKLQLSDVDVLNKIDGDKELLLNKFFSYLDGVPFKSASSIAS
jgi:hypothetical protein